MLKFNLMRSLLLLFLSGIFISSCSNEFDGTDGIKTVHFPNSELVKQVVNYKDGKRIGELREYYRNGNLKVKQYYKNDTLTDSCITYYENGNLQLIQFIKDKKKEGAWKKFNEQGKMFEEVNYKNDERDGYATKYSYRSLKLLEKKHYVNGKEEGKQEFYYLNGKPKAICYSSGNAPCLGTQEWDESGKQINNDFTISTYEENKLLLTGKFLIHVKLSNPKQDDELRAVTDTNSTNCLTTIYKVGKIGDEFLIEYQIARGGFIMENLKIAATRTTDLGNKFVKTKTLKIAANNY